MMARLDKRDDAFRDVVNGLAQDLVQVNYEHASAYINLPLLYPSGSHVTVRINQLNDECFSVSDAGIGFDEADLACIGDQFNQIAPSIATAAGVHFERQTFSLETSREQLASTVSIIATCSLEAVQGAAASKPNNPSDLTLSRPSARPIPWHQASSAPTIALLIGLTKLLQQLQTAVDSAEGAKDFDATAWLGRWLTEPVPALGGHKPIEYLDTIEGQARVSRLLSQMTSGAYA